jgi:hypothetical protein
MIGDREEFLLAHLPNGLRLTSVLITDEHPPQHVYRVHGPEGTLIGEHQTLVAFIDHLDGLDARHVITEPGRPPRLPADDRPAR